MIKKNYNIIIQARLDSTRLPNKVLIDLCGLPIIQWVYNGVKKSKFVDKIIFAIPNTKKNDLLNSYLRKFNFNIFRGSTDDVLKRFYMAAKKFNSNKVIRVCSDNPFISGKEIDNLIKFYDQNNYDYVYNHIPLNNTYPDGLGAEIIDFRILQILHKTVKSKFEREHIFTHIHKNKNKFKIATFNPNSNSLRHPNIKLDIDNYTDLEKFVQIINNKNIKTTTLLKKIIQYEYKKNI